MILTSDSCFTCFYLFCCKNQHDNGADSTIDKICSIIDRIFNETL